jgi:hypothetical protein
MPINVLRNKTPQQVYDDVNGFAQRYVQDWRRWLAAPPPARPRLFGEILRNWRATRPNPMRRLRAQARHGPPFLDDLLARSEAPIATLGNLDVRAVRHRTDPENQALSNLWEIFLHLPSRNFATCMGITKAILLLTDGRLGPAFDSNVRHNLQIAQPTTCATWVATLEEIADDIIAFEDAHGLLTETVPKEFAHLAYGRLLDMAFGPR